MRKIAAGVHLVQVNQPMAFSNLGDLAGILPALGESALVPPVAGGTDAGGSTPLVGEIAAQATS